MFLKNFKVVAEQLLKLWGLVFSELETGEKLFFLGWILGRSCFFLSWRLGQMNFDFFRLTIFP